MSSKPTSTSWPYRPEFASKPQSNRLFDVFNQFADRSQSAFRKRPREASEAKEVLIKLAPPLLDTATSSSSASFRNKRLRISKSDQSTASTTENVKTSEPPKAPASTKLDETTDTPATDGTPEETSSSDKSTGTKEQKSEPATQEEVDPSVERYLSEIHTNEKDLQTIEDKKQRLQKEVVDLWGAYRYGLTQIGSLTDLAHAPDAIMPGNF